MTETRQFYFVASSVRKSVWSFGRQLRGPRPISSRRPRRVPLRTRPRRTYEEWAAHYTTAILPARTIGGHAETAPLLDQRRFRPNIEIGFGNDLTLVAVNLEFDCVSFTKEVARNERQCGRNRDGGRPIPTKKTGRRLAFQTITVKLKWLRLRYGLE